MDISARFLAFTTYGVQWVLWLLIGLSVISVGIMLERLWYFATYQPDAKRLAGQLRKLLLAGPARPEDSESAGQADAHEAALEGVKAQTRLDLERNLAFLGTLGSNAPFIGLFGTVLGIIKAFHDLAGNQAGGPAVVMAGISEALVATAVGLMVAIPAVVAFNYFSRRVRSTMTQVDWMTHMALADIKATAAHSATDERPAERVVSTPPVAVWQRRMVPIAVVGGLFLIFVGLLIGRSGQPAPTRVETTQEAKPPVIPPIMAPTSTQVAAPAAVAPTAPAGSPTAVAPALPTAVAPTGTGPEFIGPPAPTNPPAAAGSSAPIGTPAAVGSPPGPPTAAPPVTSPGPAAPPTATAPAVPLVAPATPGAKPAQPAAAGKPPYRKPFFKGKKRKGAPPPAGAAPATPESAPPAAAAKPEGAAPAETGTP